MFRSQESTAVVISAEGDEVVEVAAASAAPPANRVRPGYSLMLNDGNAGPGWGAFLAAVQPNEAD